MIHVFKKYMKLHQIYKNLDKISKKNNIETIEKSIQKTVKDQISYYYNKSYAKGFIQNK